LEAFLLFVAAKVIYGGSLSCGLRYKHWFFNVTNKFSVEAQFEIFCDGMKIHSCFGFGPKISMQSKICKERELFRFQINIQLGFKREFTLQDCLEF